MTKIPDHVKRSRSLWTNTGRRRPPFAIPPAVGQESVWDFPRPPAIVPDDREVTVRFRGVEVARTTHAVRVCETASPPTFYIPPNDVRLELLAKSDQRSFCEWKGQASYWTLALPGRPPQAAVAWSYARPFPEFDRIRDYLCFYPARVDCLVAGRAVTPQPGGFYGGWITPEVVGPFKGDPGTSGW